LHFFSRRLKETWLIEQKRNREMQARTRDDGSQARRRTLKAQVVCSGICSEKIKEKEEMMS